MISVLTHALEEGDSDKVRRPKQDLLTRMGCAKVMLLYVTYPDRGLNLAGSQLARNRTDEETSPHRYHK